MTPHVIVVDDKSSMWGNVVRVHGPYPTRHDALMDKERVSSLYPRRAFIEVSELTPGEFTAPASAPRKRKRIVLDDNVSIKGVPASEINRMVQP